MKTRIAVNTTSINAVIPMANHRADSRDIHPFGCHFDAKWQPNGWMSRESALWFAIGITAFMLVVFTAILVFMYFQKSPGALAGTMLAFSYAVVGFVYYINISVVERNLNGAPIRLSRAMMLLVVAAIVLTIA